VMSWEKAPLGVSASKPSTAVMVDTPGLSDTEFAAKSALICTTERIRPKT